MKFYVNNKRAYAHDFDATEFDLIMICVSKFKPRKSGIKPLFITNAGNAQGINDPSKSLPGCLHVQVEHETDAVSAASTLHS